MAHGHFPERDIAQLRRLLDDACKGIAAAEAALAHHSRPEARLTAINFPSKKRSSAKPLVYGASGGTE